MAIDKATLKKKAPLIAGGAAALALLIGGGLWWVDKSNWVDTDNAYVQADTVSVSPQIAGYVAEVLVSDNQRVQPGQVLVRLDPAEASAALEQAEARVAALRAAVANVDDRAALEAAQVGERAAALQSARAQADLARADLDRYGRLAEQGYVSSQRIQSTRAKAAEAEAGVNQAAAGLEAQRRAAGALGSVRAQTLAELRQAEAAVERARLDLDRTLIRAPVAGVVGARGVRPGQYVRPGGQLMSVVPLGDAYVVANFKETQVGRLALGQTVEIEADAFPGRVIRGRVDSFSPATGSEFALIPVENATGNFTKIVQRVPVKIAVDRSEPLASALRPGLSLTVRVDLRSRGGASFAEAAQAAAVPAYAEARAR